MVPYTVPRHKVAAVGSVHGRQFLEISTASVSLFIIIPAFERSLIPSALLHTTVLLVVSNKSPWATADGISMCLPSLASCSPTWTANYLLSLVTTS